MGDRVGCLLCDRLAKTRGLCPKHYPPRLAEVKAGRMTWADYEAIGEAEKPRNRRRWGLDGECDR